MLLLKTPLPVLVKSLPCYITPLPKTSFAYEEATGATNEGVIGVNKATGNQPSCFFISCFTASESLTSPYLLILRSNLSNTNKVALAANLGKICLAKWTEMSTRDFFAKISFDVVYLTIKKSNWLNCCRQLINSISSDLQKFARYQ